MAKKKYKVKKIGKVKLAVKYKKWETPMKPRIPTTITHADQRWPSRADDKRELRKLTEDIVTT